MHPDVIVISPPLCQQRNQHHQVPEKKQGRKAPEVGIVLPSNTPITHSSINTNVNAHFSTSVHQRKTNKKKLAIDLIIRQKQCFY